MTDMKPMKTHYRGTRLFVAVLAWLTGVASLAFIKDGPAPLFVGIIVACIEYRLAVLLIDIADHTRHAIDQRQRIIWLLENQAEKKTEQRLDSPLPPMPLTPARLESMLRSIWECRGNPVFVKQLWSEFTAIMSAQGRTPDDAAFIAMIDRLVDEGIMKPDHATNLKTRLGLV